MWDLYDFDVDVEIPFTWLTSPIIGADVPKYYVNVK